MKINERNACWQGQPVELVKSEQGSLHCFQACVVMALKALKNISITLAEAEVLTNFVSGRDTWPHKGFLSFADAGIKVTSVETMNPELFVADPVAEINRIYDDAEIAAYVIGITDIEEERKLVKQCLEAPLVNFAVRAPDWEDIYTTLSAGGLVIATIDYGVLHNTGKYEGHMVLITAISAEGVCIFDPGPPGAANWNISLELFGRALFPEGSSGQLMLLLPEENA